MSKYENHALQVDINFNGDPNGGIFIQKGYVDGYEFSFVFESWGTGRLEQCVHSDDNSDCSDNEQKRISFDNSEPVQVTMIHNPPESFVYIDSTLVFARNDLDTDHGRGDMWFSIFSERLPGDLTIELDNLKVWDLDMLEY
jgi:hypothetical protein